MKKKWYVPCFILGVWVLLLFVLVAVERTSADASIQSFADALWYSIVTLTTVGYGDVYPVTVLGRCIGVILVILSMGLMTFLLGYFLSLMLGRVWPLLRLRFLRDREWYIFSVCNGESKVLAANLKKENPQGIFIFLQTTEGIKEAPQGRNFFCPEVELSELIKIKRNANYRYFIAEEEGYTKLQKAIAEGGRGEIYCHTELVPEEVPVQVHLFDRYDCCSRLYWRGKPLKQQESKIILIGNGKYGNALLERALLNNILSMEQHVEYHVFGDWSDFKCNHSELEKMVNVDALGEKADTLYLHDEKWCGCRELIESADRVIICGDNERENLEILNRLRRYFSLCGSVHIRGSQKLDMAYTFGTEEELFSTELVMGTKLNKIAMLMNEIYGRSIGENAPNWRELSEFAKQSNIAAAEHLLVKIQILLGDEVRGKITRESYAEAYAKYVETKPEKAIGYRKLEHERWMRFYILNNWKYGPERNNAEKIHPLLVPFEDLTPEEQAKDDFAWELLKEVAERL